MIYDNWIVSWHVVLSVVIWMVKYGSRLYLRRSSHVTSFSWEEMHKKRRIYACPAIPSGCSLFHFPAMEKAFFVLHPFPHETSTAKHQLYHDRHQAMQGVWHLWGNWPENHVNIFTAPLVRVTGELTQCQYVENVMCSCFLQSYTHLVLWYYKK